MTRYDFVTPTPDGKEESRSRLREFGALTVDDDVTIS